MMSKPKTNATKVSREAPSTKAQGSISQDWAVAQAQKSWQALSAPPKKPK